MKLQAIIAYFCQHYPYSNELSNSRLTKLVYLADWFNCLSVGVQMTSITWVFNHYGPYVDDVLNAVYESKALEIVQDFNFYGNPKYIVKLIDNPEDLYIMCLTDNDVSVLDFVINKTKSMYYNDFIDYVYSTYPVVISQRYDLLDLVSLAKQYKDSNKLE